METFIIMAITCTIDGNCMRLEIGPALYSILSKRKCTVNLSINNNTLSKKLIYKPGQANQVNGECISAIRKVPKDQLSH